ncbi:PLDc N-terminal domain-containing protein [Salinibacterium sp.]|uniref:PLDc N-terminal domain-containing protein n=1 Tax=Salinibacterium sp. TaxID=1915057 RepID=UPI00286D2F58|nr:PLDc N-terminal domain-containing protein [Salinibacterium sp.]
MSSVEPVHVVAFIVVFMSWITVWILAIASILRRPNVTGFERGVWIVVVIVFPFVGPLVWAVWGRTRSGLVPLSPDGSPSR